MNCTRCGKDLATTVSYPIDPIGVKPRRWVCIRCLKESEIKENEARTSKLVSDILDAYFGASPKEIEDGYEEITKGEKGK